MTDSDEDELEAGDGDVVILDKLVRLLNDVARLLMSKPFVMLERCWVCMMSLKHEDLRVNLAFSSSNFFFSLPIARFVMSVLNVGC